jgi:hypothetical protein
VKDIKRFDLGILIAAVALVAGASGFAIGHFTAPKATVASTSQNSAGGGNGSFFRTGGQRPVFGTVASVSGDTITVNDQRTGSTETVTVNSSTTYSDGSGSGASVNLASIASGTSIAAMGTTDSSGNVTSATRIIVNPQFHGFSGSGGGGGSGTSSGGSNVLLN